MIVRGRHPRLRQAGIGVAMLAPALILFGTFVAYPAVRAIWISMHRWTGFSPRETWVGGEHFFYLFGKSAAEWFPWMLLAAGVAVAATLGGRGITHWGSDAGVRRTGRCVSIAGRVLLLGVAVGFLGVWMFAWSDGDGFFRACVRNNFTYMILGGAFHFVFAFLFAAALNLPGFRGKIFYRTMIFFPSFISAVGVAMLWHRMYDPRYGILNFVLKFFRISGFEWLSGDNVLNSIIVCGVWAGVGSQMILLLAGMQRIPKTYYEAARIDGAGEGTIFTRITVPLLREVILIVVTLWVIGSLKAFGLFQAFSIGRTEKNSVISVRQYELAFSNRDNIYQMGLATAMAVILMVLIVVFAGLLRSLREREQVEY